MNRIFPARSTIMIESGAVSRIDRNRASDPRPSLSISSGPTCSRSPSLDMVAALSGMVPPFVRAHNKSLASRASQTGDARAGLTGPADQNLIRIAREKGAAGLDSPATGDTRLGVVAKERHSIGA